MRQIQRQATLQGYEQPHRQDLLAPKRTRWNLDADKIIQRLNHHESFTVEADYELTDMPRFTDMVNYKVSEKEQSALWALETRRLVEIINLGEPLELEGLDEWYGASGTAGFDRLHRLGTQLGFASRICQLDNELFQLELYPKNSNPKDFRTIRRDLQLRFGPEARKHSRFHRIDLAERNSECYQALVNYITGTLAQVLMRTAEGSFWDENIVIGIAKLAAKLKIVGSRLPEAAAICLAGANQWESRLRHQQKEDFPVPATEDLSNARDKQFFAVQPDIFPVGYEYFYLVADFHQSINEMIFQITVELVLPWNMGADESFETSTVMYHTGFLQRLAILFQQRSGTIGGSSNPNEVRCAGFALEVCLEQLESLHASSYGSPPTKGENFPDKHASIYWKWTPIASQGGGEKAENSWDDAINGRDMFFGNPRTGIMNLNSMKDVIAALVPFVMTQARLPTRLNYLTGIATIFKGPEAVRCCEGQRFLASFVVRTSNAKSSIDPNITSISLSDVAQKRALSEWPCSETAASLHQSSRKSHNELCEELRAINVRVARGLKLFDSWTVDEKCIIIPYRWYCWGCLSIAALLVLGGLAIGFSVEKRIPGVDPSNISVFCWALAGFLIILFKSSRVQEWPWRDFFLGYVVCKSVTEVVAVTSIDPQLLLSILLYLEPVMLLQKRGPFGTIYLRKDPDDGFAIDVPPKAEAINEGGGFFIKVQGIAGPALVCLRLNYGTPHNAIKPQHYWDERIDVHCPHLDTPWCWGKEQDKGRLYSLSTGKVVWKRMVGLQCENAYFH